MTAPRLQSPLLDRGYSVQEVTWRTEQGPWHRGTPQPRPHPGTASAHVQVPLVDGIDDLQMPRQQLLKHRYRPALQGLWQHSVVGVCTGILCDLPGLEHSRTFQYALFRNKQVFCQIANQGESLGLKADVQIPPERGAAGHMPLFSGACLEPFSKPAGGPHTLHFLDIIHIHFAS